MSSLVREWAIWVLRSTTRTVLINDLRWHFAFSLADGRDPAPRRRPQAKSGLDSLATESTRIRIARDELRRIRELTRPTDKPERELAEFVAQLAPRLLA